MSPVPARIALPTVEQSRLSVVVVTWRNAELLERCLASLAQQATAPVPFETVVLLSGADDDVADLVRHRVTGARVVESRTNLGLGGGANRAVATTSSELLVFLNDHIEVGERWLERLVETADAWPGAGAVGSRALDSHGQLAEAGAVLWQNGSVWPVGRGLPGDTARYRHLRRVDCSSGSSLLVRRATWDAVGGFDRTYFPGYYQDVDLCLSIARLGQSVLCEPRSVVRHNESSSLDHRYEAFVSGRSHRRFCDKWRSELGRFLPEPDGMASIAPNAEEADALPAVQAAVLASRQLGRRALVVDPGPQHDGGLARPGIEALAAAGWAVTTTAGDPDALGRLGVEVTERDVTAHLARAPVLYDAVVITGPYLSGDLVPFIRDRQRVALIARAGPVAPGGLEAEGAATLEPDQPQTWPAALDAALRRRVATGPLV